MVEQKQTIPIDKTPLKWSDAGDIAENILKGTISHGANYTLGPLEWAFDHNISKDLLGIPEYEDWKQDYRTGFEEGDFGALRHLDKLSHLTGIVGPLGAYKGITMLPKGMEVAKRYFPGFKYLDDIAILNHLAKMKQAKDAGTAVGLLGTKVGRLWQGTKDFGKVIGQSIGRPLRHLVQPKRWSKKFDVSKPPYVDRSGKRTFSLPERELFKNIRDLGIGAGGTRLASKTLVPKKNIEIELDGQILSDRWPDHPGR